jgi:hypothetical protein
MSSITAMCRLTTPLALLSLDVIVQAMDHASPPALQQLRLVRVVHSELPVPPELPCLPGCPPACPPPFAVSAVFHSRVPPPPLPPALLQLLAGLVHMTLSTEAFQTEVALRVDQLAVSR